MEHPLPRSLPESKLNDLAQRTDYRVFYDGIFRHVLRVRVPGTEGHHAVKMVRKIPEKLVSFTSLSQQVSHFLHLSLWSLLRLNILVKQIEALLFLK